MPHKIDPCTHSCESRLLCYCAWGRPVLLGRCAAYSGLLLGAHGLSTTGARLSHIPFSQTQAARMLPLLRNVDSHVSDCAALVRRAVAFLGIRIPFAILLISVPPLRIASLFKKFWPGPGLSVEYKFCGGAGVRFRP